MSGSGIAKRGFTHFSSDLSRLSEDSSTAHVCIDTHHIFIVLTWLLVSQADAPTFHGTRFVERECILL